MSKLKDKDVALACYAMVSGMFALFTNPKARGPNFTWNNFPAMMKDHCGTTIFCHIVSSKKIEEIRIQKLAESYGEEIATTLVKRMESL